ncbi:hypothetical protein VRU48_02890 [Pedobacter sp. KR3-3]|uniref:DUF7477 domain-containing protein n=1 Tax=Pedobacter albus TaxID=3113905 RepID=A0ABU7I3K4_9SPHI|nr:hypothetical protein [Pedobacter sp. KR3-3]MEE1944038.1 hypothetical protein [Pedobacter sp. KR3-3]
MKKTLFLLFVVVLSQLAKAQNCPQGTVQFAFTPAQNVQVVACKQTEVSLGKQSVFWGVKNLTNDKLYVKFVKVVTTTCGKVMRSNGDTYLKPGEFVGGTTFSGEITFETQVWKEDCNDPKNRIQSIAYEGLTIRNISEEERKKEQQRNATAPKSNQSPAAPSKTTNTQPSTTTATGNVPRPQEQPRQPQVSQQQIAQQQQRQQLIQQQLNQLSQKSQAQANVANSLLSGLASILNSSQARNAKRNIASDNDERDRQFEELKSQLKEGNGHLVACSSCDGEGYTECRVCGGEGEKKCSSCNGKGGETCPVCRGSGKGSFNMACTYCFGKGTKDCLICGNTGKELCTTCNGLGKRFCTSCRGTGQKFERDYGQPAPAYNPTPAEPVPNYNYSAPVVRAVPFEMQSFQLDFSQDWLKKKWNEEHYHITSILSNKGKYTLVMSTNSGYTAQIYRTKKTFPADTIKKYWDLGYHITDLTGDAINGWRVVLSKNSGLNGQSYKYDTALPLAYIKEYWDKDYYITSTASDKNGTWAVVMSTSAPFTAQSYQYETAVPAAFIKTYWDKNYYITSAAVNKGVWLVVVSQTPLYKSQSYKVSDVFPTDWVKEYWDKGYRITTIAESGKWLVVMSQFN